MVRKIPAADMAVKNGAWDKKGMQGVELKNKTLAIIGCGRIGQVVASSATVMGMNVIGYDPVMTAEEMGKFGIKKMDLSDIWGQTDFITIHAPLTEGTKNLINDDSIALCKDGVRIVNCARGGIVDEAALLRGLQSGKVAGAALDVYTSEPPKEELAELIAHPNLVCTPHLGASTEEAQVNVARDIAMQISDVFENKDYYGVINVSYMGIAMDKEMKPFMNLAETIGMMQASLTPGKTKTIEIRTWGGRSVNIATKMARELLEAQVLKGLMKNSVPDSDPDLISAPGMAKEYGIVSRISEELPENVGSPYWNLVSVRVEKEDGHCNTITGAVFGNTPHIVHINEYKDLFAFAPTGRCMLVFENDDTPGAISDVLEVLHRAEVNIASVNVAPSQKKKDPPRAMCFMSLDHDVPAKSMTQLRALQNVRSVSKIAL